MNIVKNILLLAGMGLALSILIGLGFWQLDRAKQKEKILEQYQEAMQAAPITMANLPKDYATVNFRRILLEGEFLNERNFLLDNKFYKHQFGYHVITPVKLVENEQIILVDRGWIAQKNRNKLPQIPELSGVQKFRGIIYHPTPSLLLGRLEDNPGKYPRIIEVIDMAALHKILRKNIYPFLVVSDNLGQGLMQEFNPVIVSSSRHIAYAFQWFGLAIVFFAGCTIVILRHFNIISPRQQHE
jgi:surfeit locus 1 family protein